MQILRGKPERKTGRRVVVDLNKAERALRDGRRREAEEICRDVLEERPGHAHALHVLAEIRLREGALEAAEDFLRQAETSEPGNPRTFNLLGQVRRRQDKPQEAEDLFRRAVELKPEYPDALANLGDLLREGGRLEEAEAAYREALRHDMEHGRANLSLGEVLYGHGQPEQAVPHLQAGLKREFADRAGQFVLARALLELGRVDEAITAYRRLVAAGERQPSAFAELASALRAVGDTEGASAGYEAALELDPGDGRAAAGLAEILSATGRPAAGRAMLAARLREGDASAAVRVAYARTLKAQGRDREALVMLAPVLEETAPATDAVDARYLVGDILDGMGERDRAFAHYSKANALQRAAYDPQERERYIDSLVQVLTPETLETIPAGSESDVPVFIVGMPRSGTALVERVIAAHPRGAGTGPLPHIALSAGRIGRYNKAGIPYPQCVTLLRRRDVQEISSAYLVRMFTGKERARRIADRMWVNFEHLGFIEILFPKARIIHCRRDPMDTGISCYGNRLDIVTAPFATKLAHIGHYYGQYRRLMDHWASRSGLRILDVDYEGLVSSPEEQARNIMDFLELPWDPACLELTGTTVYDTSVGRAGHYARQLAPLAEALAAAGYPPKH